MLINSSLFTFDSVFNRVAFSFAFGAIIGIGLQIYSDYKTRKYKADAVEKDFDPDHKWIISLFCNVEKAFEFCQEAVGQLKNGKIYLADYEAKVIKARTGMSLRSFGNMVEFKLNAVTENLTEVEFSTKPTVPTTLIDYGESLKIVKILTSFLESKNNDLNYKQLEANSVIPIEFFEQNFASKTNIKN